MIIGHGDVASALVSVKKDHDILFFASGVSNSACEDLSEFNRERDLLLSQPRDRHVVYFSSLSIYYSNSMYADFKFSMESVIRNWFDNHTIVRLGNIAWGTNPNTLINYLRNRIKNNLPLTVKDVYRFVVSKTDFVEAMNTIIWQRPDEMNLHGERLTVAQIVSRIKDGLL